MNVLLHWTPLKACTVYNRSALISIFFVSWTISMSILSRNGCWNWPSSLFTAYKTAFESYSHEYPCTFPPFCRLKGSQSKVQVQIDKTKWPQMRSTNRTRCINWLPVKELCVSPGLKWWLMRHSSRPEDHQFNKTPALSTSLHKIKLCCPAEVCSCHKTSLVN